ncbi:MAG: hypothetical protein XE08_0296 [Parcubacteria bacterium 32_520]|nr:MAG: hypothetical protein XE08_0296 [Parcubacteria bacterium 32_520]
MENKNNVIISSLIVIILIFSISFYLFISFVSLPQKEKEIEELNQYIGKFKDDNYENKIIEISNAIKLMEQIAILGIQEKIRGYEISDVDIALDGRTQFNLNFYFSEELIK